MKLGNVTVDGVNTKRKQDKTKDGVEIYTETTITLKVIDAEPEVVSQLAHFTGEEAIAVEFGNQLGMAGMMRD